MDVKLLEWWSWLIEISVNREMKISVLQLSRNIRRIAELLNGRKTLGEVRVQGWVRRVRKKSKLLFINISDGYTNDTVQVVIPREKCSSLPLGSAVDISGTWSISEGSEQEYELKASSCHIVGSNSYNSFQKSSDSLREKLHLRLKSPAFCEFLRARSLITQFTHDFFKSQNYVHIDAPVISHNDCEGAGEAFVVEAPNGSPFFGDDKVYLPVSSQLHLEAAAGSIPRVYTLSSAFRAEKSLSRQHLAEFHMLEAEYAFAENVQELCDVVEEYMRFIVENAAKLTHTLQDFRSLFGDSEMKTLTNIGLESKKYPRITYDEAVSILLKLNLHTSSKGLNKQQELSLVEHFGSPLFVTHFPAELKPFYMSRTEGGKYAECFDFLGPVAGELAGGSLREHNPAILRSRGCGDVLSWYTELRECGHPPTAGFGVGIERLLQSLFGIINIKDSVAFPRWFRHCQC
ncbi:hypothetical protein AB6A40_004240 [Gnathostoma spinigerum]|uniref:Aminoacyl-transfer RNA synthetases class-II family profile domain-containing protein n=1 Tax=Gnathostoma spinigerum TaxID=75299 RepID=A0ABD6EJE6_9BILA